MRRKKECSEVCADEFCSLPVRPKSMALLYCLLYCLRDTMPCGLSRDMCLMYERWVQRKCSRKG